VPVRLELIDALSRGVKLNRLCQNTVAIVRVFDVELIDMQPQGGFPERLKRGLRLFTSDVLLSLWQSYSGCVYCLLIAVSLSSCWLTFVWPGPMYWCPSRKCASRMRSGLSASAGVLELGIKSSFMGGGWV
jgi:hypothetical protein